MLKTLSSESWKLQPVIKMNVHGNTQIHLFFPGVECMDHTLRLPILALTFWIGNILW